MACVGYSSGYHAILGRDFQASSLAPLSLPVRQIPLVAFDSSMLAIRRSIINFETSAVVIAYEVVRRISARQELAGLRRDVTADGAAPPPAGPPRPTGTGPEVAPA